MIKAWVDFRLEGNILIELEDGVKLTEEMMKLALDNVNIPGYLLRKFDVVYEQQSEQD